MAAINYDAQGFIIGLNRIEHQTQSVHEDTQEIIRILRGQLEQMREANTRARRNQNRRTSTIGDRNSSGSTGDGSASRDGNTDNNANRADSSSDSRITRRAENIDALNSPAPTLHNQDLKNHQEHLRDERGQFIRANFDTNTDTSRQPQERRERQHQTQSVHEDTQEIIRILRGQLEQMREANTRARRNQNRRTSTIGDRNSSGSTGDGSASRDGNTSGHDGGNHGNGDSQIIRRANNHRSLTDSSSGDTDNSTRVSHSARLRDSHGRFRRANDDSGDSTTEASSRSTRDGLANRSGDASNRANRMDGSDTSRLTGRNTSNTDDSTQTANRGSQNQRQNTADTSSTGTDSARSRTERLRDSRGRFTSENANANSDARRDRRRAERRDRQRDSNGRFTRENDGAFKKLLDALKLDTDTNNLDPLLDSLNELQGVFSPVFKMAKGIWKAGAWTTSKLFARARRTPLPNEQRHQNRFMRRVLAAILRSIRARNGGSLLSSLLGGRRISRLLGAGGLLGGVLGLLRGGLMGGLRGGLRGGTGLLRALGKRTPLLGALLGGVGLAANWDKLKGDDRAAGVGGLTGGTLGAIAGGALGSLAGPIGTAVGAAAGGWLGEKGGEWLGKNLAPTIKEWGQSLKRADLPNKLLSFTKFAINPIFGGLSLFSDSLNNWAKNITSFDFRGRLSKLLDGLKNALGSMFDGGGDGRQSLWSGVVDKFKGWFGLGGSGDTGALVSNAASQVGINEKVNRNKILEYQRAIGINSKDVMAWCASFVGAMLEQSGFESTRSASAASYDNYGTPLDVKQSLPSGSIGTVARKGGSGRHVFIIEKDNGDGTISTIEGNYGDKVTRNIRKKSELISARAPVAKSGSVATTSAEPFMGIPPIKQTSAQQTARAQQAVQYFMSQGWTREQAIGIAANLQKESGFNNAVTGDDGKAYGIAQWHPDRQANFQRAFGKSIKTSTFNEQLAFVHHELTRGTEQGAGKRLRGARNAGEAAAIVSQYYERPLAVQKEKIERAQIANQLKAQLGNVAPAVMPNTVAARQDSTQNIFNAANQAKLQSTGSIATPASRVSTQAIFNAAHPVNNQVQNKSSIGTISPSTYARPNIITRANMAQGKKSASPQIKTPKTPSIVMPKVSEKLNTSNNQKTVLSVLNQQQMPQNVSDRGIAHAVTGGLGEHRFWQ